MLVIEGADFASALSDFLKMRLRFTLHRYNVDRPLMEYITNDVPADVWTIDRVALVRFHLAALNAGYASPQVFREIDISLACARAKLVLAVGKNDNSGRLADFYARSMMEKCVHSEEQPISDLLSWLNIPSGMIV